MIGKTGAVLLLLLAAPSWLPGGGASAQVPDTAAARRAIERQAGQAVSQEEILDRIRESGLTREQARLRLRQAGEDPTLLDPYYDILEEAGPPPGRRDPDAFARALGALGRAPRTVPGPVPPPQRDTIPAAVETARPSELRRFGNELFERRTSEFQPVLYGPVDANYRLGPGDEVLVVLTGAVESAYSLEVNRQGYVIIPEVGQVPVNGKTIAELEQTLRQYLGRVYSGVRGPEPTIQFTASLGRLRTNQVFIVGEVEQPGAIQVSAVATVFTALYQAGGPNEVGTYRRIQVWRGDEVVRSVDVYDYLLRGDSRDDVRLDNGDRIHVGLAGKTVSISGAVRRPARYELLPGETLRDLIGYAGGFAAEAVVRRLQIDRILPPSVRRPGSDRVVVDVDLAGVLAGDPEALRLEDGDAVRVFAVSGERRNRVTVSGDVNRPGTYQWRPGMTLTDLVGEAEGLREAAYTPRIHVYRLNEARGDRQLLSASLLGEDDGEGSGAELRLADMDSVVVYSRRTLRTPELVHIDGFVKEPGTYPLAEGMSIRDLVLAAGGFRSGAHVADAEVARQPPEGLRTDTTALVMQVGLARTGGRVEDGAWEVPVWRPHATEFRLQNQDRVFIRKAPGYDEPRAVTVAGEVAFPGTYVLARRQERLSDVLERAGGFTSEVHIEGIRVVRDGRLVAVDAARALRDREGALNIVMEAGDSVQVPQYDPTVLVLGAVNFESRVLYQPGRDLGYYIGRAGGYLDSADRARVSVTRQNGERATVRKLLMMRGAPEVTPGSTIYVPPVPPAERGGVSLDIMLTRLVSIASVTATLLVAISQLN